MFPTAQIVDWVEHTWWKPSCNHGKPVYEKEIASAADVNAFIHFWDDRDGKSLRGWRMGPVGGSDEVWAFNHGHHSKENLMLPTRGWKVPWHGAVDIYLEVISDASKRDSKVKSLPACFIWCRKNLGEPDASWWTFVKRSQQQMKYTSR